MNEMSFWVERIILSPRVIVLKILFKITVPDDDLLRTETFAEL
jgi:hypothetical protein